MYYVERSVGVLVRSVVTTGGGQWNVYNKIQMCACWGMCNLPKEKWRNMKKWCFLEGKMSFWCFPEDKKG